MRSSGLVSFLIAFGFLVFFATRERFDAPDAAEWLEPAEYLEDTLLATLVNEGGVRYVRKASKLGIQGLLGVPFVMGISNAEQIADKEAASFCGGECCHRCIASD